MVLRDIEEKVVPYCIENGKKILAYSPLERGLLTGNMKPSYKSGDGDQRATRDFYKDENLKRTNEFLDKIKPIGNGSIIAKSWSISYENGVF